MARRQLPKAYLRIDPNIDAHPDPPTMLLLIVWANRQRERGRFRHLDQLRRIVGRRQLIEALERGDLVELKGGVFYLAGWDEWQEGDLTVGERVRRVRERRSNAEADLSPSERYTGVSPPLPERSTTSEALGRKGVRADPPTPPADAGGPSPRGGHGNGRLLAPSTVETLRELDCYDATTDVSDGEPSPEEGDAL
jgi:hypothetical protein